MYFDIFVIFMIVLLIFLIGLEVNNYVFDKNHTYPMELSENETFEDYESKIADLKKFPSKLKPTYENQYSIINNRINVNKINKIDEKAFVFYENDICKDFNVDNENSTLDSITRELSCKEMNDYLNDTVKVKYHENIPTKTIVEFSKIPVEKWGKEKIILTNIKYKIKQSQLKNEANNNDNDNDNDNDSIDNYVNLNQKIKYINVVINKFIKLMNENFESSKYFKKYNKYHPFESYKLTSYKILKYFMYEQEKLNSDKEKVKLKYQRGVIKINLHRLYKMNDFTILFDIFFIPRDNFDQIFKEESDFKDAYHFYIKTVRVIGNPVRHFSRFLEEDDTDYIQTEFKIITEDMYKDLKTIKNLSTNKKLTNTETQYKKLFEEIMVINQNKTFNSIIFRELLFKMQKIAKPRESVSNENKSEIEIIYEKLIEKFILHCKDLLNSRKILKKDLDQDISFSESQLQGQTIFTNDINDLIKDYKTTPDYEIKKLNSLNPKYRCYDPRFTDKVLDAYTTRTSCISYHDDIGVNGVYDKKCEKDEDCPFFRSNTNYPNDFGGCNEGICEVPVGLGVIGGTKVNNIGKPLCHNCDLVKDNENLTFLEDGKCCHLQFNNPDFDSADFMFKNDKKIRFKHRSFLEDKGLKP